MRTLILNEDLKTLLQGVAGVAAVGLLMGAVAHPNLREGDKPEGPQILLAGGGERGVQTVSDPGVGAYGARLPEYVIGTDAARPRAEPAWWASDPEPQEEDTGPAVVFTGDDDPAQVQVTHAAWRDEPRPEPEYPSARGGATYEANLPGPPPPPPEGDDATLDLR